PSSHRMACADGVSSIEICDVRIGQLHKSFLLLTFDRRRSKLLSNFSTTVYGPPNTTSSGHTRSADTPRAGNRGAPRSRRIATNRADDEGGFRRQTWLAVSGASPTRGGGLAEILLGRVRKQPSCQVLPVDESWLSTVGRRNR